MENLSVNIFNYHLKNINTNPYILVARITFELDDTNDDIEDATFHLYICHLAVECKESN